MDACHQCVHWWFLTECGLLEVGGSRLQVVGGRGQEDGEQEGVDCVYDFVSSVKNYQGASGTFSVNADGSANRTPVIKVVKDGKFVSVK